MLIKCQNGNNLFYRPGDTRKAWTIRVVRLAMQFYTHVNIWNCEYLVHYQHYVALGLGCIGLLLTCVGLGDRGFHSPFLKLLGPSLFITGNFLKNVRKYMYTFIFRIVTALPENHNVLLSKNETKKDPRSRGRPLWIGWSMITISDFLLVTMMMVSLTRVRHHDFSVWIPSLCIPAHDIVRYLGVQLYQCRSNKNIPIKIFFLLLVKY